MLWHSVEGSFKQSLFQNNFYNISLKHTVMNIYISFIFEMDKYIFAIFNVSQLPYTCMNLWSKFLKQSFQFSLIVMFKFMIPPLWYVHKVLNKSTVVLFDFIVFDKTTFCLFVIMFSLLEWDASHFILVSGICFVLFVLQTMFWVLPWSTIFGRDFYFMFFFFIPN